MIKYLKHLLENRSHELKHIRFADILREHVVSADLEHTGLCSRALMLPKREACQMNILQEDLKEQSSKPETPPVSRSSDRLSCPLSPTQNKTTQVKAETLFPQAHLPNSHFLSC